MRYPDRRKKENAKLRAYIDAIADAKQFTKETWADNLIAGNSAFISLEEWISYLEHCALEEAAKVCGVSDKIRQLIAS